MMATRSLWTNERVGIVYTGVVKWSALLLLYSSCFSIEAYFSIQIISNHQSTFRCKTSSNFLLQPRNFVDVTSRSLTNLDMSSSRNNNNQDKTQEQFTSMSGLQRRTTNNQDTNDEFFWQQQKELAMQMTENIVQSKKQQSSVKYQKRVSGLVTDTSFFTFYIFCALWILFPNPFVPISYSIGSSCGIAYSYGLGKYVQTVGSSIDDVTGDIQGAGVGAARFAFLIILFILVGKFRAEGLLEIPAILGFFTYQIASLNQGLRTIND